MLFSDDNGKSWGNAVIVHRETEDTLEDSYLYLSDNTILGIHIASLGKTGIVQRLSTDNGQTWTEQGIIPTENPPRTPILLGVRISGGKLVAIMYYSMPTP